MTTETVLYTGIGAMGTVVVALVGWMLFLIKILYGKFTECETDRKELRAQQNADRMATAAQILTLTHDTAQLQAQLEAMRACPLDVCPMRRKNAPGP